MILFLYGLLTFSVGYLTARYIQFLKTKHNSNEESKETRA
jgi:hypothetical protein